ncbi:MAG: RNA polymerase sigma factor [Vulcanimicrobiota bacterium]
MASLPLTETLGIRLGLTSGEFRAVREEPRSLIARACSGEAGAIEELVEYYQDTIYSIAMTFTRNPHRAEDLAQDAWIRIIRGLSTFKQDSRFTTWVYRITMNTFLNSTRKRELNLDADERVLEEPRGDEGRGQAMLDTSLAVQEAVRELPDEFRAVVALRFAADLSYKEIAQVLDVPLGTVQSRLKRGLTRLAERLGSDSAEGVPVVAD